MELLKSSFILFALGLNLVFGTALGQQKDRKKWHIINSKPGHYELQKIDDKKLTYPIQIESLGYQFKESREVKEKPIALLVYFAGAAGTYESIDIYRAVVFHTKKKKFYGDFPFRLISSLKDKTYPDTIFSFGKNNFTVTDKISGLKKVIPY